MGHHHYEDAIDTETGKTRKESVELLKEKEKEIDRLEKEKEEIIKKDEIKNQRALDLSTLLGQLKEERGELDKEIIEITLELNKLCTHERIRTENRSYAGGYLDRAEYWTDYFCEICGVKVDEKVEYGGFA